MYLISNNKDSAGMSSWPYANLPSSNKFRSNQTETENAEILKNYPSEISDDSSTRNASFNLITLYLLRLRVF